MLITFERFVFIFTVYPQRLAKEPCECLHLVGSWGDAKSWLQNRVSEIKNGTPTNLAGSNHDRIQVLAFRLPDGYQDHQAENSLNNLAKFYLRHNEMETL